MFVSQSEITAFVLSDSGNGLFPLGALVLFQIIGLLFSLDAVPGVGLNRVPEVRRVFSFQKS